MEKQYNPVLQQKVRDFIASAGSQEKAAELMKKYSAAALSTYRRGIYEGSISEIEKFLSEFFGNREDASATYSFEGYIPTSISEDVYQTIRMCHKRGSFTTECGDPGIGKTMAALKYMRDYPGSTVMVTMNPCFSSISSCLKALCRSLRIDYPGRHDDAWLSIEQGLRGGRKVLIIDEAQFLTVRMLDILRSIFDKNPELGIVLIGNEGIVGKRKNRDGKTKTEYKQIDGRNKWTDIRHTYHFSKEDAAKVFPMLKGKELELMHVIMQGDRGIRGAVATFETAMQNENITYEGILAAAKKGGIVLY